MKKSVIAVVSLVGLLFSQCVSVQTIDLDGNAVSGRTGNKEKTKNQKSVAALQYQEGDLMAEDWKAVGNLTLIKSEGGYAIRAKEAGNREALLTREFDRPLSFNGGLGIRVVGRSEGSVAPTLKLELVDENGYVTNEKDMELELAQGEISNEYFFNLNGAFVQLHPEIADVDGKRIRRINLYVNPKGDEFTGNIHLEEIKVIYGAQIVHEGKGPEGKDGGVVEDFMKSSSWTSNKKNISLLPGSGHLRVEMNEVGPSHESFEGEVETVNVQNAKKFTVKAKVAGEKPLFLRMDLVDANGVATNYLPVIVRLNPSSEMQELVFDFEGRLEQSYPMAALDVKRISGVRIYPNPAYQPYTGTLIIEEIKAIP